jgi:pimeloyl-ACP methyl ester carboxylesterase
VSPAAQFLTIDGIRLEYAWHGAAATAAPTLVFLHEGLGSLSMWRDFPAKLAERTGCGAFIFSRAGYGLSDPAPLPRPVRFMHDEADRLPAILDAVDIIDPILIGHSDGASIAIIYAGSGHTPEPRGLILEAPHVFTEPSGLASIARIGEQFLTTDLRQRLTRHHGDNVDIAFRGWNDVWLHPDFVGWNIEEYLPAIDQPMLIIQGTDDEYGTWKQVIAIERQVSGPVETLLLERCGHAPHRDRRAETFEAMAEFIVRIAL